MAPSTCNNTADNAVGKNFIPNAASATFHYSGDDTQEAADDGKDSTGLAKLNACVSKFPAANLLKRHFAE